MLLLFNRWSEIDWSQFLDVCLQSNTKRGQCDYPAFTPYEQLQMAERDVCEYLRDAFRENAFKCAAWALDGQYKAVLRLEKYMNGYLITGLETAANERRKGYAEALLRSILTVLPGICIYSHINRNNFSSIQLHEKCGFVRILDYAAFLDGSVSTTAVTYCIQT